MFKGEWGTGVLTPEEEKAWKRSGLWHGILLGISAVFCAFYFIFGKFVNFINRSDIRLKNAICAEWGALLLGRNASFFY